MNVYDIMEMIRLGEGWNIEFKEILPKPSKLAQTIVAFANHQGGTILIGISNRGRIIGFEPSKEDYDNILRTAREVVNPPIRYEEVKEFVVNHKKIVALKIPAGVDQVYSTSDGRYLKRENRENVAIDWRILYQLITKRERISFEELICEGAFFEDINLEKVKCYIKAREERFGSKIEIPVGDILLSRKCVVRKNGKLLPTNAGILLFGKEPRKFLSQNYITLIKFRGIEVSEDYLDRKDISGTLTDIVNQTVRWVDERMLHGGIIMEESVQRREVMQFHLSSLREIIVNAVAHRDYGIRGRRIIISMFDDRLEVQSPGPLPANITPENIIHEQYARNPNIMLILLEWGYSEAIGRGIDDIFKNLREGGYQLPKMVDTGASFIFTLYSKHIGEVNKGLANLNDRQKKAIEYIKENGEITNREYRSINRVSNVIAVFELQSLVKKGILSREGRGRATHYIILHC